MSRLSAYLMVGVGALLMLLPFYFMFVFATHSKSDIFRLPPPLFFGADFSGNLAILLKQIPFWKNLGWSFYVASISTALTLLFSSMGGYAFAMFEFHGKKALFALVMGTMLIPPFLGMIPTFMIMDLLGWISLVEAARMDGCSEWAIFFKVILPLLGPALGTLGLISFIASWNNFIGPLVVMRSVEHYTLPLALRSMQSPMNAEWGAIMAGSAIAVLPLLILFVFSSRRMIDGMTAGAVRG
jgi:multiple sugar transport system permease protein